MRKREGGGREGGGRGGEEGGIKDLFLEHSWNT